MQRNGETLSASFGYSEFTTWPWSFEEDLRKYSAHGANAIEVCEFKLAHNDYARLADLEQHGLTPSSIQMPIHSVFVDSMASTPADPDDRIVAMEESIARTAPHVPKGTPFIVITGVPPQGNFAKTIERTVEALKTLGGFAADYGMRIAFEPLSPVNIHTDTAVWYLDQGLEIVDRVGDPNVGICIDTWNVWQTPSLSDVIRQCGKRIFVIQLSDWKTPRSTADRYSLGTGEIPLASIVRAIRATGYTGAWVVEILSSMHLEGSIWKRNLDDVLDENRRAFERLWQETSAALASQ
jgi:sugar phosphate isomerase/epimerase